MTRLDPGTATVWLPSMNLSRLHAVRRVDAFTQGPIVALCGREIPFGMAQIRGQSPPKCGHCLKRIGEAK